jgi:hypothetical protein
VAFSTGANENGQLALGHREKQLEFKQINFPNEKIV